MATTTTPRKRSRGLDILQLVLGLAALGGMMVVMWMSLMYARDATKVAGDEELGQRSC